LGKNTVKEPWRNYVNEVINRFSSLLRLESVIVFGSWGRGGGGVWSDVDILIITDDVKDINILNRFRLVSEYKVPNTDVFLYTYSELRRMLKRGNPLAISALAEGIPLIISARVRKLMELARRCYVRRERVWMRVCEFIP